MTINKFALPILLSASGMAHAQSSVTLYGLLSSGLNYTSNQGGNASYQLQSGAIQAQRWGLRGTEDLGGDTKAIFVLESGFDLMTGKSGQGGREFGRQAYVGISSDSYGTLTLGRQYDSIVDYVQGFTANGKWGILFSHPGDNDNTDAGFRIDNAVKYRSANYNGLTFEGLYSFGGIAGEVSRNSVESVGVGYTRGGFSAGVAYMHIDHPAAAVTEGFWGSSNTVDGQYGANASAYAVLGAGATYVAGTLSGSVAATQSKFSNGLDAQSVVLRNYEINGAWYVRPAFMLGGGYTYTQGHVDATGATPKYHQVNLIADYFLSKLTDVYVVATWQHAMGDAQYAQVDAITPAASGSNQLAVQIGMRHKF